MLRRQAEAWFYESVPDRQTLPGANDENSASQPTSIFCAQPPSNINTHAERVKITEYAPDDDACADAADTEAHGHSDLYAARRWECDGGAP